jgi:hypothetical protein
MKLLALLVLIQVSTPKPIDPNVGACHELIFHELIFISQDELEDATGIRLNQIKTPKQAPDPTSQDPTVEKYRAALALLKDYKTIQRRTDEHPDVKRLYQTKNGWKPP